MMPLTFGDAKQPDFGLEHGLAASASGGSHPTQGASAVDGCFAQPAVSLGADTPDHFHACAGTGSGVDNFAMLRMCKARRLEPELIYRQKSQHGFSISTAQEHRSRPRTAKIHNPSHLP